MNTNDGLQKYMEKLRNNPELRKAPLDPMEKAKQNPQSLRLAINAKCYDCTCGQRNEVKLCVMNDCPLWHLRPWK